MLKRLEFQLFENEQIYQQRFEHANVAEFFLIKLGKNNIPSSNINIFLSSTVLNDGQLHIIEEHKNYLSFSYYFDFLIFSQLNNKKKKTILLNLTCSIICKIYNYFLIEHFVVLNTYEKIVRNNYNFEWLFKNKLFMIGDKYVSILYYCDIGIYKIFEVLYDKNKIEIKRRCVFYDYVCSFKIEYIRIIDDSFFIYKFNGPSKIFRSCITDILNKEDIIEMINVSKFFKNK